MLLGIDTFVPSDPATADQPLSDQSSNVRLCRELLEQIELADRVGLGVIGIGEHHRPDYLASTPAMFLAAAAARTKQIRLSSAVTVLSSEDPVRVFQQYATLDLISGGRAEIIVGRGSFIESYPLFGFDLDHYDELFAEKLELLLRLRGEVNVKWNGRHRSALTGQGVYPRPVQRPLPIRLGVGGTPASFTRAGVLGLPLTVAIIGGEPHRFRPLVDRYREAYRRAGHDPAGMDVAVHSFGFIAPTAEEAFDIFAPAYLQIMNRIGQERGWSPMIRSQFDTLTGPLGALVIGSPEMVMAKLRHIDESLGGVSQVSVQLNPSNVGHESQMMAIELLGSLP